jgi:hypothetical protein
VIQRGRKNSTNHQKRHNKRQQQTYTNLQSAWSAKTIGSSIAHWARQQLCTLRRCNLRPRATRARAHAEDELLLSSFEPILSLSRRFQIQEQGRFRSVIS